MRKLLGLFFDLLYHQFAWAYDLVAAAVSLGRWKSWVLSVTPFLRGRVLELGFGPGHLQVALNEAGLPAFGLELSRQMARQASRRLRKKGHPVQLTIGYAQSLPFATDCFNCLAATFPSEYIFEAQTLEEIQRVLKPGGQLLIVPSAWISGRSALERLAAGLFRLTGQAGALERVLPGMERRLAMSGFTLRHELVKQPGSQVLVLVAEKE
jgi:ubiquinone/menaquinone biosynthesis C-methylase UbiE